MGEQAAKRLEGLFYPQTVCLHEITLKYLLLTYDRLHFLPVEDVRVEPGRESIRGRFSLNDTLLFSAFGTREDTGYSLMYTGDESGWDRRLESLMDVYDELEDRGVFVRLDHPDLTGPIGHHPLRPAVEADLADAEFLAACERSRNRKYFLPSDATSASLKGGGAVFRGLPYREPFLAPGLCSERLNTTLFFAGLHGLVPVCDNRAFVDLLGAKLKRATEDPNFVEDHQDALKEGFKFGILSWEVMIEAVPKRALAKRTTDDILRYKEESKELTVAFKTYLDRLRLMVAEEPWSNRFRRELEKIVKLELLPELGRVRESKRELWNKLFHEAIKATMQKGVLIPLFSLYAVPGISYLDLVCYGTAAGSWLGKTGPALIDAWQAEKKLKRNALFFVMNLQR